MGYSRTSFGKSEAAGAFLSVLLYQGYQSMVGVLLTSRFVVHTTALEVVVNNSWVHCGKFVPIISSMF